MPDDNLALLRECFAIIATGDADALVARYTPDYVLELPYRATDKLFSVEGHDAVRRYLHKIFASRRFELSIRQVHPTLDTDLVIAEYTSEGKLFSTGEPIRNVYVGFWWFRDGKVCRTREYYNPTLAVATPAR